PHEPLLTGWLRAYFTLCAREVHHKIFLFALDSRFNITYILLVNVFKQQIDTAKSAAGRERRMGKSRRRAADRPWLHPDSVDAPEVTSVSSHEQPLHLRDGAGFLRVARCHSPSLGRCALVPPSGSAQRANGCA
ncbi:MAG TPA: hypothetical protein VJQ42_01820, partial [Rhodanobacteraceae bacterium]|nr:hypothetical protein [Rhodanobacteraceae bacterium]